MEDDYVACVRPLQSITKAFGRPDDPNALYLREFIIDAKPGYPLPPPQVARVMSIVMISFIARGHPFLLDIEKCNPLQGNPPKDFELWTQRFADAPGVPEGLTPAQRAQVLFCIGRALTFLDSHGVSHGSVTQENIFVQIGGSGQAVAKLGFAADFSRDSHAADLENFKGLASEVIGEVTGLDIEGVLNLLKERFEPDLRELLQEVDRYEAKIAPTPQYLSPDVLFGVLEPNGRRKWEKIRSLLDRARHERRGDFFAFLGQLYEAGMGVDKDGVMAYDFYQKGEELGSELCASNLGKLESLDYPDPQIRGQVLAKLGQPELAAEAFAKCATPLGVARFGEFLLSCVDTCKAGERLLEAAASKGCGFAAFALATRQFKLGNDMYEKRREGELLNQSAWIAALGYCNRAVQLGFPDAAYLAGVIAARLGRYDEMANWFRQAANDFADPVAKAALDRFDLGPTDL
jgi:tetratricopeptide (TPR) repeat protein